MDKGIRLQVRWMPSHLRLDEPLPEGISASDIYGNSYADDLAGKAAASACVPLNVSSPYLYYTRLTKRKRISSKRDPQNNENLKI